MKNKWDIILCNIYWWFEHVVLLVLLFVIEIHDSKIQ